MIKVCGSTFYVQKSNQMVYDLVGMFVKMGVDFLIETQRSDF
jgi:hypothetical protein